MASLNRVSLIGNLGANPEIRYTPNGTATCTVNLATTDKWKHKETGEPVERTEWHRVVFYKGLAQILVDYATSGSQLFVEGSLRTREYEKDGVTRYATEIVAREMQLLGKKPQGGPAPTTAENDTSDDFEDDLPY